MDRKELWLEVLNKLAEVGEHLNTVGNDDFNEVDYYYKHAIETTLNGYAKTYSK